MQYVITAYDGENALEQRMAVRPRHLESVANLGKHIVCAGGLLDEEGKMKGSVLIVDFADRAELDQYLNQEPYILEGVWERVKHTIQRTSAERKDHEVLYTDKPEIWHRYGGRLADIYP